MNDTEESITRAVVGLLDACPFMGDVSFASLQDTGVAVYPTGAPVVRRERRSITGHIAQSCAYDLGLVCREYGQDEARKMAAKDLLDYVGAWLEMQPVNIGGTVYLLDAYPALTGQRRITRIERTSAAAIEAATEDGGTVWSIAVRVSYSNEYDTNTEDIL